MARQPKTLVVVGEKGSGKTIETLKGTIYPYVVGSQRSKARKAIIFDVNNEFSSFDFPNPKTGKMDTHSIQRILIRDIPRFSESNIIQLRRVAPFWDNDTPMTLDDMAVALEKIISCFRNGLLLAEDINLYTSESMKGDLVGRLATLRHFGLDLVLHYQSIAMALTPKILKFTTDIRLHKAQDSVSTNKNKAIEKVDLLSIAENVVADRYKHGMNNGTNDRFFSVWVDVQKSKITGEFSKKEAQQAIMRYASANSNRLMKPYLNQRDLNGKKIPIMEETAYSSVMSDLMGQYFAFNT